MWKLFQKPGIFVGNPDFDDAEAFAHRLASHNFAWCAVKVLQGTSVQNVDWLDVHNWANIMRSHGITFGLWGYHMTSPSVEAKLASDLISHFDDVSKSVFYIADCEAEYTSWGGDISRSQAFVSAFRALRPNRQAALTSYGGATYGNNLSSVFNYTPWRNGSFDFMPQTYFQQAPEYEPANCIAQAIDAGWGATSVHPIFGVYDDVLGRISGQQYAYLYRNCVKRFGIAGCSLFNAENTTDDDLAGIQSVFA